MMMKSILLLLLVLLIISCMCLETYDFLTPFPFDDIEAIQYIPVMVEQRSNIIQLYKNTKPEQAVYALFLSSGFGLTNKFKNIIDDNFESILSMFIDQISNNNSIHKFDNRKRPMITLPVNIDGVSKILYYYENDSVIDVVYQFLNSSIELPSNYHYDNALVGQLKYRINKIISQVEAFHNIKDAFEDDVQSLCQDNNKNVNKDNGYDSSQILVNHFASLDIFNTFVINLRQSVGRRDYMKKQLLRAKLRSHSFLMPGIDPTVLAKIVLNEVIKHNPSGTSVFLEGYVAASLAHIQTWNEIVNNNLPFGIILEDDVELHPSIKCSLQKVFQMIPSNWSMIYLYYDDDLNFAPLKNTNIPCGQSVKESKQPIIHLKGLCSAGNARSYILSYQGAVDLLKNAIPMTTIGIDDYMRDMIFHNQINAYAITPALSSVQGNAVPSDSVFNAFGKWLKWTPPFRVY